MDGPRQDGFDVFLGTYLPPASALGEFQLFVDRRPLIIQSIPYIFAASVFMIAISMLSRPVPNATVWPLRLFIIVWVAICAWCVRFMFAHGMLFVRSSPDIPFDLC